MKDSILNELNQKYLSWYTGQESGDPAKYLKLTQVHCISYSRKLPFSMTLIDCGTCQ